MLNCALNLLIMVHKNYLLSSFIWFITDFLENCQGKVSAENFRFSPSQKDFPQENFAQRKFRIARRLLLRVVLMRLITRATKDSEDCTNVFRALDRSASNFHEIFAQLLFFYYLSTHHPSFFFFKHQHLCFSYHFALIKAASYGSAGTSGASNSMANSIGIGSAAGECRDYTGRTIQHAMHFVPPGVDMCKLCICENGHAKVSLRLFLLK